jgi:DUF1680 family protein
MTFTIKLRIPDWAQYFNINVNNNRINQNVREDGYVWLNREWKQSDTIELEFPMSVKRIVAHPDVKNNEGRVAIQRGPIIYGFEGIDNGDTMDITVAKDAQFEHLFRPDFLGGIVTISGKKTDGEKFLAIPYYALANRGKSRQTVWVYQQNFKRPMEGWSKKLYQTMD